MGTRIGGASGREVADIEEDSDMARKVGERDTYSHTEGTSTKVMKIFLLWPSQFYKKQNIFHFS